MATTFTPQQQLVRTSLAAMNPAQFAKLRMYLDAVRVATDGRLAQIEAERQMLLTRKQKLDAALQRLSRNDAFDALRGALQRGERLRAQPAAPAAQPGKPAKPAKRPTKTPVKKPGKRPAKRPAKRPGQRPVKRPGG